MTNRMKSQIIRFLFVGFVTVGIDFLCYRLFLALAISANVAKISSFLCGTVFSFYANRSWTFNESPAGQDLNQKLRFLALYLSTLGINALVNAACLSLLKGGWVINFAFLAATGTSTVLNFLGMKFIVFKSHSVQHVG